MKEKYYLIERLSTKRAGRVHFYDCITGIGPACTKDKGRAQQYSSAEEARRRAPIHWGCFWAVVKEDENGMRLVDTPRGEVWTIDDSLHVTIDENDE